MSGAAHRELREVAEIVRQTVRPHEIDKATRYVGLEDIRGSELLRTSSVFEAGVSSSKFAFPVGAILYGKLRPNLGKVALAPTSGVCSTDILPVLAGPDVEPRFLHRFLASPGVVAEATRLASGANLPRLSPTQLARLRVPLPPLNEQRRIADVLDRADALRAKRRETLARLDELTQSSFQRRFELTSTPEPRPLGGCLVGTPRNGLYKPASQYGTGVRIVRIDSFSPGATIDPAVLKRVSVSEDELMRWQVGPGTVLINRVNSLTHIGKAGLVPELDEPLIFESNMMAVTPAPDELLPEFLVAALTRPAARRQFRRRARPAVNQASVNQRDVSQITVPVPPIEEQRRFVEFLHSVRAARRARHAHLALLDELFASLQQRAFRGDLFSSPLPAELDQLADAVA